MSEQMRTEQSAEIDAIESGPPCESCGRETVWVETGYDCGAVCPGAGRYGR